MTAPQFWHRTCADMAFEDIVGALRCTLSSVAKKPPGKPKRSSKDVNPKVELVARKGSELAHKGDFSNALAHFEKVLTVDPKHLYALYGAAHCKSHLMEHLRGGERDAAMDGVLAFCHRL